MNKNKIKSLLAELNIDCLIENIEFVGESSISNCSGSGTENRN